MSVWSMISLHWGTAFPCPRRARRYCWDALSLPLSGHGPPVSNDSPPLRAIGIGAGIACSGAEREQHDARQRVVTRTMNMTVHVPLYYLLPCVCPFITSWPTFEVPCRAIKSKSTRNCMRFLVQPDSQHYKSQNVLWCGIFVATRWQADANSVMSICAHHPSQRQISTPVSSGRSVALGRYGWGAPSPAKRSLSTLPAHFPPPLNGDSVLGQTKGRLLCPKLKLRGFWN